MNVYQGISGLKSLPTGATLSIGNFDGVHLGHRSILQLMRSLQHGSGAPLAVVTFEPHPLTVIKPEIAPPRLTSPDLKHRLLEEQGVTHYVVLPPSPEVLGLSAEQFWTILRDVVKPAHLVEGSTFTFGKDRAGNVARLKEWASGTQINLHIAQGLSVALLDLSVVPVSSSLIRWLISYGRVRDAAICLGRPYALDGQVGHGHERGRAIGVPTANLQCADQLVPADGVYVGRCVIDGMTHACAVSIGTTPTFNDVVRQVEAHVLDFGGDLYGNTLHVELVDWLRDQRKFRSVDALKQQIAVDIAAARLRSGADPARSIAEMVGCV